MKYCEDKKGTKIGNKGGGLTLCRVVGKSFPHGASTVPKNWRDLANGYYSSHRKLCLRSLRQEGAQLSCELSVG